MRTAVAFREARRPSTLPAHNRDHTSMAAHNPVALLLLPMNVQSSSACSSMISKSRNIRWLTRFAAVEARSSHRAMVWRAWPVTRAVADMLTPSTRRLATWSNSLRAQRRPLYAVPVCVLTVPPQTVQRYRQRRPHFVGNEPGPTMLRPSFSTVVTPALGAGHPVDRVHRSRVPGGEPAVFAQDLGGEGDRSTATGASTRTRAPLVGEAPSVGILPVNFDLCTNAEAGRHAGRLTGRAPRGAPAADGDAVAVEDERAVGVAACPPPRQGLGDGL